MTQTNCYYPPHLPVFEHESDILSAVRRSQISILTGETGSGKSSGSVQILKHAGYTIISTQPRIPAATSLAEFVAQALGESVGQTVGYQTSADKAYSQKGTITFMTDGLLRLKAIMGQIEDKEELVIIVDEHHERSENIDTLTAFLLDLLKKKARFHLMFSSATADVDRLKKWLGKSFNQEIPHVHINGRTFPIQEHLIEAEATLRMTTQELMQGKNVLVFQPGIREIDNFCQELNELDLEIEIIPLHSKLTKEQKDLALKTDYGHPKVVIATNIAETSMTIPDIDVVVDTGLEWRPGVTVNGTSVLMLSPIANANCDQRKGRCGRTKPGTYYLAGVPREQREKYSPAEISSGNLHALSLQLHKTGINPEDLHWLDEPDMVQYHVASKYLINMGALGADGCITPIGEEMICYPVDPIYARMIVEGRKRGVLADVLLMVAVISTGRHLFDPDHPLYHKLYTDAHCDFALMQAIFLKTYQAQNTEQPTDLEAWLELRGINPNHYKQATALYLLLCTRASITPYQGFTPPHQQAQAKEASIVSGLWPYGIWYVSDGNKVVNQAGRRRIISKGSVQPSQGQFVVGRPFNLRLEDQSSLKFLQSVTTLSPETLEQLFPDGFTFTLPKDKPAKKKSCKKKAHQRKPRKVRR